MIAALARWWCRRRGHSARWDSYRVDEGPYFWWCPMCKLYHRLGAYDWPHEAALS